jgi:hypothetical protein
LNVRQQLEELAGNRGDLVMAQVQRLQLRVRTQPVNRYCVYALKLEGHLEKLVQLPAGRWLRELAARRVTVI